VQVIAQDQGRCRERAGLPAFNQRAAKPFHRRGAGLRDGDAGPRHFIFQAFQPGGIAGTVFEKARALAHGGLVTRGGAGMA